MDTSIDDLRKYNLCVNGSDKYNAWIESKKKTYIPKTKTNENIVPVLKVCKACGITADYRKIIHMTLPSGNKSYLCTKHATQVDKYGKVMDHN